MVIKHKQGVKHAISGYAASVKCRAHRVPTVFNFQLFASLPRSHLLLMLMEWQKFFVHFFNDTFYVESVMHKMMCNKYKNIEKCDLRHICIIFKKKLCVISSVYSSGTIFHLKVFFSVWINAKHCIVRWMTGANVNWTTKKANQMKWKCAVQCHGNGIRLKLGSYTLHHLLVRPIWISTRKRKLNYERQSKQIYTNIF